MLWSIIVLAIGILMVVKPDILWKIECLLRMKDGDANQTYLMLSRIFGVFLVVWAIVLGVGAV